MRCRKSSSKREIYSDTGLPQETRKISNKQSNLAPKKTRIKGTKEKKTNASVVTSRIESAVFHKLFKWEKKTTRNMK